MQSDANYANSNILLFFNPLFLNISTNPNIGLMMPSVNLPPPPSCRQAISETTSLTHNLSHPPTPQSQLYIQKYIGKMVAVVMTMMVVVVMMTMMKVMVMMTTSVISSLSFCWQPDTTLISLSLFFIATFIFSLFVSLIKRFSYESLSLPLHRWLLITTKTWSDIGLRSIIPLL